MNNENDSHNDSHPYSWIIKETSYTAVYTCSSIQVCVRVHACMWMWEWDQTQAPPDALTAPPTRTPTEPAPQAGAPPVHPVQEEKKNQNIAYVEKGFSNHH